MALKGTGKIENLRRIPMTPTIEDEEPPIELWEPPPRKRISGAPSRLEMEAMAADVPGSLLERLVHKILQDMGIAFIYKYGVVGARQARGGYEIDFLISNYIPPVALEVMGAYWHGPATRYQDAMRATVLTSLGYKVVEIAEEDILMLSPMELEDKIEDLLGVPLFQWRSP